MINARSSFINVIRKIKRYANDKSKNGETYCLKIMKSFQVSSLFGLSLVYM